MLSDKIDSTSQDKSKSSENNTTIDIELKLMEVGDQKYRIDMKQNGQSRFFIISETTAGNFRSRVVVPMCFFEEFYACLVEILNFSSTYECANVSEKKLPRDQTVFAKSWSCFSPGGRRYYFDLIDAKNSLNLRVSYVFSGRRDSIRITVDALPNLAEVIEDFRKKYPSISNTDDYPANTNYDRRRPAGGRRGMGNMRGLRNFGPRLYNRNRGRIGLSQFNGNGSAPRDPVNGNKKSNSLKVLPECAPLTVVSNSKKYIFEIVAGDNTFLRVTEAINDNFKSSLHIPVEVVSQVQTIIAEMNNKYSSIKTHQQSAAVAKA